MLCDPLKRGSVLYRPMRFQVKVGNDIIGFSELQGGDPPMGVAGGRLLPTPAYASIQPYCIKHRDDGVSIPELTVEAAGGVPLKCRGSIQIIDFSPELGERKRNRNPA